MPRTRLQSRCTIYHELMCLMTPLSSFGIFRLTDPPGLTTILECNAKEAFHPHPDLPIYTVSELFNSGICYIDPNLHRMPIRVMFKFVIYLLKLLICDFRVVRSFLFCFYLYIPCTLSPTYCNNFNKPLCIAFFHVTTSSYPHPRCILYNYLYLIY